MGCLDNEADEVKLVLRDLRRILSRIRKKQAEYHLAYAVGKNTKHMPSVGISLATRE